MTPAETALEIHDLSKTFAGQVALDSVSLSVGLREIHALVGQNGSGKSTLIKILAGFHQPDPDSGGAAVHGRSLELGSASAAHEGGVRFVHQDLGLLLDLSVTENLMIGNQYPKGFGGHIKWREANRVAHKMLATVGIRADVRAPVSSMGLAERTAVAIARALPSEGEKVLLVLDEPTAALPADDVDRLFAIIRRLKAAGNSILIVSHHLDEVLQLADTVTVLRDGRNAAVAATADVDHEQLSRLIVGHALDAPVERREPTDMTAAPVLAIEHLAGGTVVDVSMVVHPGEIVGIAGLTGSGREMVAALISGRLSREGKVFVGGQFVEPFDPRSASRCGLAAVPGERARYGVFPGLTVRHNMTTGSLRRHVRRGRINNRSERKEVKDWVQRFGIVTRSSESLINSLSGGNQQKVLVARALRLGPRVLVLDDPTAGIDIMAREQVHRIIAASAEEGAAVLLVSTDSDELARLSDRVLVLGRGLVRTELRRGVDLSTERINHAQVSVGSSFVHS